MERWIRPDGGVSRFCGMRFGVRLLWTVYVLTTSTIRLRFGGQGCPLLRDRPQILKLRVYEHYYPRSDEYRCHLYLMGPGLPHKHNPTVRSDIWSNISASHLLDRFETKAHGPSDHAELTTVLFRDNGPRHEMAIVVAAPGLLGGRPPCTDADVVTAPSIGKRTNPITYRNEKRRTPMRQKVFVQIYDTHCSTGQSASESRAQAIVH